VVAVQLNTNNGDALAATRTGHAFRAEAGHTVGLMRVEYQVRTAEGVVA